MSIGELKARLGMQPIIDSEYVDFVGGRFEGKANSLEKSMGYFLQLCHFTYTNGKPNANLGAILSQIDPEVFKIDLIELHKTRQGSVKILKK